MFKWIVRKVVRNLDVQTRAKGRVGNQNQKKVIVEVKILWGDEVVARFDRSVKI